MDGVTVKSADPPGRPASTGQDQDHTTACSCACACACAPITREGRPAMTDRQPSSAPTGDAAQRFLNAQTDRQKAWDALKGFFASEQIDDANLRRVTIIAQVAIDQVFAAYKLDPEQQSIRHGEVFDYAEVSSLYGFVLGMQVARAQMQGAA